jgi:hypothetical protein
MLVLNYIVYGSLIILYVETNEPLRPCFFFPPLPTRKWSLPQILAQLTEILKLLGRTS